MPCPSGSARRVRRRLTGSLGGAGTHRDHSRLGRSSRPVPARAASGGDRPARRSAGRRRGRGTGPVGSSMTRSSSQWLTSTCVWMSIVPSSLVASTTRWAGRRVRASVCSVMSTSTGGRCCACSCGQHQGHDHDRVRARVEVDLVASSRGARAGDVARGRRHARDREVAAQAVDQRERVDVDARIGRRAAERRLGPRVLRRAAVPRGVPDRHRVEVDVEGVARDVRLRLRVLGPDVDLERRAVEVHGLPRAGRPARRGSSPRSCRRTARPMRRGSPGASGPASPWDP